MVVFIGLLQHRQEEYQYQRGHEGEQETHLECGDKLRYCCQQVEQIEKILELVEQHQRHKRQQRVLLILDTIGHRLPPMHVGIEPTLTILYPSLS